MAAPHELLNVFLVDDDINIGRTLSIGLKALGCQVTVENSVLKALEILQSRSFDLVLTDFRMGEKTGSDIIKEAKRADPQALVAVMTAFASIDNAIEVTRDGAFDYLPKPFTQVQLGHLLKKVRMVVALKRENQELKKSGNRRGFFAGMTSVAGLRLEDFVKKVAPTEATVVLVGESGTGKSELSHYIHQSSSRASKPFVVVNCTSLTESLLESEIFGHVKGSFTGATQDKAGKFELAHHGTLFLDEIGDLSLNAQSKLLRFLQEKVIERVGSNKTISVDARVITATNKNLEEAVAEGKFREDLYYRLNVFECTMTPIRHRQEDIPIFIQRFLQEFSLNSGNLQQVSIPGEIMDLLLKYNWPGNIREIRNVMERLVLLSGGQELRKSDLPERIVNFREKSTSLLSSDKELLSLEEVSKRHIQKVLEAEPNLDKATEILGITKVTLWRRRKEYGLP